MINFVSLLVGYFVGSISVSAISAKLRHGEDLAKEGSLTWASYYRKHGLRPTWPAAVGELLKGTLAAFLAYSISGGDQLSVVFAGLGAMAGHAYSLYFKFRGGKSISAGGGVLLFMGLQEPVLLLILGVALVVGILIWRRTAIISTGSLSAATFTWLAVLVVHIFLGRIPGPYVGFTLMGCFFIYILFRKNIVALWNRTEHETAFPTHPPDLK